jgi:flagellar hook assembly protein FlgD
MTVSPVGRGSTPATKSPAQGLAANFDNFLKLLTTQLQKQDPLAPMDAASFTSQLVEFASVEQAIQANTRLAELSRLIEASGISSAMGLLGQEVTASTDKISLAAEGEGHRQLVGRRSRRVGCYRPYAAAATPVISAQSSNALVRAARYSAAVT